MAEETKRKHIFVLSGQSNMAGRGGVRNRHWDGAVPPECRPHPSVLRLSAASLWEEAREPLHGDIDAAKPCGVGPGMPFANALLAHLSSAGTPDVAAVVGLVPCAVGGTAICEWARGERLYEEMVRRAREAAEAADGGEIRAVLWFQGESDTLSDAAANAYRAKMERLILDVRADLQLLPLPFIQVALASGNHPHIDKVREAQLGIDLPNVICVDAKGLPLNEDHLHLSTEAQVRLGNMLAEAYIKHFSSPLAQRDVRADRAVPQTEMAEEAKKTKHIFVLSGQSNMAGRGGVRKHQCDSVSNRHWDDAVPLECLPHPSILRLSAASLWEEARDPLHADIDSTKPCGVGPGMPFANALLAHLFRAGTADSAVVGLVPCAVGGTAICEWARGERLYEEMVRRAREAAAAADGGEIRAVLWFQGESDTPSDAAASTYRANMERLILNIRSDLQLPSLPFIQVALASGDHPHIDKVREAQLGIDLPNVICVDAKGLPLNEDHLHLSTEAQLQLGNMLAEAYIKHFLSPLG